jgi:ferredoxin
VLCKECTSSGACPRCKADLGTGPAKKRPQPKAKEEPEDKEEPVEEEIQEEEKEEEQAPEPQPRDWSRL